MYDLLLKASSPDGLLLTIFLSLLSLPVSLFFLI